MEDSKEVITIELQSGRIAVLRLQSFDTEVDVDDILRIDYSNIMGEILTFPLMFNRIANLKAEQESIVSEAKMDMEIFEAQLREQYRKSFVEEGKKPTIDSVNDAVLMDAKYRVKKKNYFSVQKNYAYLDALYWSAQSKDTKLNRLSEKLRPEEFEKELLEGTVNGIMIKISKKVI